MYRIVGLQRVHMYSDPDNFCAEVSMANLGDGELVKPLHGFGYHRTLPDIAHSERERSFVLWSPNRGTSWHYYGTMAYDPAEIIHYHEPGLVRMHDGRLLALMRTQRWPSPSDPGEQMGPPSGYIFTAVSEDDGMSWSWPRTTRVWGYPVDGITLQDGSVLAAYSHRTKPMGAG